MIVDGIKDDEVPQDSLENKYSGLIHEFDDTAEDDDNWDSNNDEKIELSYTAMDSYIDDDEEDDNWDSETDKIQELTEEDKHQKHGKELEDYDFEADDRDYAAELEFKDELAEVETEKEEETKKEQETKEQTHIEEGYQPTADLDKQAEIKENQGKEAKDVKTDSKEQLQVKESKESELWDNANKISNEHFDKSSANIEKDRYGNDYKEPSKEEKETLSSALKDNINRVPQGERGDYRVPEPEKIKGISRDADGNTRIVEAWKDGTDGAKDGTRRMETVRAKDASGNPTYIDRIGNNNGNYFSPMKEDGTPYSLKERAIGDFLPEKNIVDNDSYHKYEVKQDFTRENFEKAIDKTYHDPDINNDMKEVLDKYYQDSESSIDTKNHDGDAYKYDGTHIDGVKSGEIDNMFGTKENPDGGGKQYITPFSAKELQNMDMIEEVERKDF